MNRWVTDIYDVKELGDMRPDSDTRLHIATVQGMVERLLYPGENEQPVPVDWYDCIVVDECHRGYNLDQEMTDAELSFRSEADYISKYRRVIDHFDGVRIGLTATPALHTTQIFGPPVFQYTYRQAVIDGWLVDHEPPYRLITALSEDGMKWQQGEEIKVLDSKTNQLQLFNTPDEVEVEIDEFNRDVLTENFNKTVCATIAEHIDPSLPGKTLIFCVTDLHADMVVRLLKEAFDELYGSVHDDAVMKIAGKADKPLQLIRRFKNEQLPKIVVTVDLLTTGVDVPPITNIRKTEPAKLAEWFQKNNATTAILMEVREGSTKYIISEHEDELRRIERGYGDAARPEDYLDAFRNYITEHLNDLPALIVVTQRPRDLTRSQLRELRLALDLAGFTETNLRTAWREPRHQLAEGRKRERP